jgi:hypothetical protein
MNRPTVGEGRVCQWARADLLRYVVSARIRVAGGWVNIDDMGRRHDSACSRIVEVAPKNRARVTAGPAWMGRV